MDDFILCQSVSKYPLHKLLVVSTKTLKKVLQSVGHITGPTNTILYLSRSYFNLVLEHRNESRIGIIILEPT